MAQARSGHRQRGGFFVPVFCARDDFALHGAAGRAASGARGDGQRVGVRGQHGGQHRGRVYLGVRVD